MTTAIYARISLDRQDGAGVDRQLEDCWALVRREGWQPVAEPYVDGSTSAFSGKHRPRYQALLAAVNAGEVSRIVAWHLDRLYRQPRELEDIIDLADAGRVQVVTVRAGDLNLGTDAGITMARVAVAFANQESRDKSKRVKRAKQQARENGLPSGGPRPMGWSATWVLDATGKKRRVLTEDPREATLIRTAVADLLGGASLAKVASRWNEAKVPQTQTGRSNWTAQLVRQVVSNPRLAGLIGHRVLKPAGDGVGQRYLPWAVVGEATWPGIVDRKQWQQLQALLAERGANGHMPRRRSLLTGLVTCAKCGATMVRSGARGHNADGVSRKVWRCMSAGGGHPSIDAAGLEALLIEATLQRADTESFATLLRQQGRQGKQAAALVAELEKLERSMDEAAASFAERKLPVRAFEKATAAIQQQQETLQRRLGSLTATQAIAPYAGKPGVLRKRWPELTVDQQRAIIGAALGRVIVGPVRKVGRPSFDARRVRIRGFERPVRTRRKA